MWGSFHFGGIRKGTDHCLKTDYNEGDQCSNPTCLSYYAAKDVMVFYFDSEHPKDTILFYVGGRADEASAERVGRLIDRLSTEIPWVIHPPYFVYQVEDHTDPETGKPVLTVGGVLEVYTAHPPWRDRLPREVDEAHYREFRTLVDHLATISKESGDEFHFEFHEELIGIIKDGELDERLETQFLGTWARALGIEPLS